MFEPNGETRVILALLLAVSVECADPDTDRGRREHRFEGLPYCVTEARRKFSAAQIAQGRAQMREIAEEMAETLKDPPSARFRNVSIIKTIGDGGKETISVCGELNAKNSYGGYTGYVPFTIFSNRVFIDDFIAGVKVGDLCVGTNTARSPQDFTAEMRQLFTVALRR